MTDTILLCEVMRRSDEVLERIHGGDRMVFVKDLAPTWAWLHDPLYISRAAADAMRDLGLILGWDCTGRLDRCVKGERAWREHLAREAEPDDAERSLNPAAGRQA